MWIRKGLNKRENKREKEKEKWKLFPGVVVWALLSHNLFLFARLWSFEFNDSVISSLRKIEEGRKTRKASKGVEEELKCDCDGNIAEIT